MGQKTKGSHMKKLGRKPGDKTRKMGVSGDLENAHEFTEDDLVTIGKESFPKANKGITGKKTQPHHARGL